MKVTSKAVCWKMLQDKRKDRVGKQIEQSMIHTRMTLLGLINPPHDSAPQTSKRKKKKQKITSALLESSCSHCAVKGCKLPVFLNLVCHKHHVPVWSVIPKKSTIKGAGKGLFACAPFDSGDWIDIYAGEALSGLRWNGDYMLQLPKSCWSVDGEHQHLGGMARFVNAAPTPSHINCVFKRIRNKTGHKEVPFFVFVLATRDIKSGEELFVDYGPEYELKNSESIDDDEDNRLFS